MSRECLISSLMIRVKLSRAGKRRSKKWQEKLRPKATLVNKPPRVSVGKLDETSTFLTTTQMITIFGVNWYIVRSMKASDYPITQFVLQIFSIIFSHVFSHIDELLIESIKKTGKKLSRAAQCSMLSRPSSRLVPSTFSSWSWWIAIWIGGRWEMD